MPKSKVRKKANRPATGGIPPVRKMIHLNPLPTDRHPTAEEQGLSILGEMYVLSVAGTQRYDKLVATNVVNHDHEEARMWLEVACMALAKAHDTIDGGTFMFDEMTKKI